MGGKKGISGDSAASLLRSFLLLAHCRLRFVRQRVRCQVAGHAFASEETCRCRSLECSSINLQEQGGKAAQEAAIEAALAEHGIDVIVLARYMQVQLQ